MLDDKISQYLDVLSKAAMKAGPQVMQFAIQHEHWCGVGQICIGFFCLVLTLLMAGIGKRVWAWCQTDNGEGLEAILLFPCVGGLMAFIVACCQLLDIWNWVAVYNPKIALFHDILNKFLEH